MLFRSAIAIVASVAIVSGASADVYTNEKTLIDGLSFTFLNVGDSETHFITLPDGKPVVGFRFEGDYTDDGPGAPTFWASDLLFTITSPGGRTWSVGGFNTPGNDPWAFQGQALSDFSGHFMSEHFPWKNDPQPKDGVWTVKFEANFGGIPGPMKWDNVKIVLYNIPGPGALAMFGVTAFILPRRRRR